MYEIWYEKKQACLSHTLVNIGIDTYCFLWIPIMDSGSVIWLEYIPILSVIFHLLISEEMFFFEGGRLECGWSDWLDLSWRPEGFSEIWTPVQKTINRCSAERNVFTISACLPTDHKPETVRSDFYQKKHYLLLTVKQDSIVISAGDVNAFVGLLSFYETHLEVLLGLNSCS